MIALVDGDVMCYRIAFACKDEPEGVAISTMASFLEEILMVDLGLANWQLYLTGKKNFRHDIAVTAPYKGNRTQEKPAHLELLRNYLVTAWGAIISEGEEADDCIAIKATELGDDCIMVSIDKDFNQVAGWHYNFVKKEKYYVSAEEGLRFFYKQILMGDKADNIVGIPKVGPVKAEKMLASAKTESEMLAVCLEAMGKERVLENGRLLWLRRQHQQMWDFPPASNLQDVSGK
jgi:5'-3' exonuclease